MKKKIIITTLFVATTISAYLVGTTKAETEVQTIEKVVEVIPDNCINMNDVVDFEATDSGLLLHFSDGTGYWWEK